ncbi:hypothetical protein RSOLAG22IIIB_03656 [Rhizoctonia solani]|uniref:Uncharacterized protein n=1 Tax=Rhizoctonia solani TaxID=456999 RepID=A0A0K6FRD6_9AGAM|nr:hypothetical protein RSOLAG22IIIB_03656 [Rhizoctonia solani]
MTLVPGTYFIHDTDSSRVLTYYYSSPFHNKVGTWGNNQWYVKRYPGGSTYGIQGVGQKKYIAIGADERDAHGVEEDGAAILELEQSNNIYFIKVTGAHSYLEHPNVASPLSSNGHTLVNFTNTTIDKNRSWRFEKINDDAGSPLKPRPGASVPTATVPESNNLLPPNSGSLYTDDAHFYTDMLFNMPRTPFTRTQRIAALDWARKLGATNVPTMESFDECERRLEAASGCNNSTNQAYKPS